MKSFMQSLQDLFTRKPVNGHTHGSITPEPAPAPEPLAAQPVEVPENLFIEKEPPVVQEPVVEKAAENRLEQFLSRNYQGIGYSDGYRYHSVEILDNYRRFLRSEFREALDHVIDDLKAYRSHLHMELVNARALSPRIAEKYATRIQCVDENILRLEQEKELSSSDEGMVMTALHEYRDGFLRGMEEHAEEVLLMGNTGIFK